MIYQPWTIGGWLSGSWRVGAWKPKKKKRKGGMSYLQALYYTNLYRDQQQAPRCKKKRTRRARTIERMTILALPAFPLF